MGNPEVSLDNYEAVYEYYRSHQQNRFVAKLAYAALALKYRPRVRYAPGAEAALKTLLERKTQLVVAVNHLTESDQFTLAATAWRTPLRRVIGRTRVLAKDELFVVPSQAQEGRHDGQHPVFRSKNYGLRAVSDAGRVMMDVAAERLGNGDCLAIFPEGTCNTEDPTRCSTSTAESATSSRAPRSWDAHRRWCRSASITVRWPATSRLRVSLSGMPVTELPDKPMDIARTVQADLQVAVDGAVAGY